mgnify:FL=1|tara:strand:+ start:246 stop:1355 length:1110 start_codon:yes stop_codon:yes gene_type:complete
MNKAVGIMISHDASICIVEDGEIKSIMQEERCSRAKHDVYPSKAYQTLFGDNFPSSELLHIEFGFTGIKYWPVNDLAQDFHLSFEQEVYSFISFVINKCSDLHTKKIKMEEKDTAAWNTKWHGTRYDEHHTFHAFSGFYNSGFKDAAVLVVDGMGNPSTIDSENHEVASIYTVEYPAKIVCHSKQETPKHHADSMKERHSHTKWPMGIGMVYSSIAAYCGFGQLGSGKIMGLASYGKEDPNIKPFVFDNYEINSRLFYRTHDGCIFIDYDYLPRDWDYRNWNEDVQKIANLCWRLQKDFERWMTKAILDTLEITGKKNIVLSGGCAMNCVANYEYLKHLPEGVKLFVDPLCEDAGISVGLAQFLYWSNQ